MKSGGVGAQTELPVKVLVIKKTKMELKDRDSEITVQFLSHPLINQNPLKQE